MRQSRSVYELSLVGILGIAVVGSTLAVARRGGDYKFFDPLVDVKRIITDRYVDKVDEKALQNGAIQGMLETLNDPYTVYVPAAEKANFDKELTGEYVGIGAQVDQKDGWLIIVTPLEDSPAYKAGLMANDKVLEIESTSTQGLSIDKCIESLQGQPGTPVKLTIERAGQKQQITVTRDRIKTLSVKGFHRDPVDPNKWQYLIDPTRKIAYIRLTQFTPQCAKLIYEALESVNASSGDLKGLVLDLRWNPGGLLNEAVSIADLFLEDGVIVSTRGRTVAEVVEKAHKEGTYPNFPIAVLVNNSSASASEVLSGALVENNRAIVVGTRTFGKGSVQGVLNIASADGAELKFTEQGYYLPSGRSITRKDDKAQWGVDPTRGFYVPMTDPELIEMLKVRRELEVIRPGDAQAEQRWSDADWILTTLKDKQLAAAVRAVQAKVDSGEWKSTGLDGVSDKGVQVGEAQRLITARDRLERELARLDRRITAVETGVSDVKTGTDFWADDLDLSGGTLEVRDKSGKVVTTLQITGNNLERWLIDADVKKLDADKPADAKPEAKAETKSEPKPEAKPESKPAEKK